MYDPSSPGFVVIDGFDISTESGFRVSIYLCFYSHLYAICFFLRRKYSFEVIHDLV